MTPPIRPHSHPHQQEHKIALHERGINPTYPTVDPYMIIACNITENIPRFLNFGYKLGIVGKLYGIVYH